MRLPPTLCSLSPLWFLSPSIEHPEIASRKARQDREGKLTTDYTDGNGFKKTTLRLMPSTYAKGYGVTGRQQDGTGCQHEKKQKNPFRKAILLRQSRIKRLKGALFNTFVFSVSSVVPPGTWNSILKQSGLKE